MLDARGAPLTQTTQNANQGAMESLIDGEVGRMLEIPSMIERAIAMVAFPQGRTASRAAPSLKGAGSAMRPPRMALKQPTRNLYEPENGVVTVTAQTATGPAAPNSIKSLNGWIAMSKTSHDELTRRRTSNAGRSA